MNGLKQRFETILDKTINRPDLQIVKRHQSGDVEEFELKEVKIEKKMKQEYDEASATTEVLKERQKQFEEASQLMSEIHKTTQDVAAEVDKQDSNLVRIEQTARAVNATTKKAKNELKVADQNRGLANSKMYNISRHNK